MSDVVVSTPYGRLRGCLVEAGGGGTEPAAGGAAPTGPDEGRVARFLGVPYAEPPTDAGRLRSPRALSAWSGVREALAPGPPSLQKLSGNQTWLYEPLAEASEDCLYVNVWSPDTRGKAPLVVWFHGGATRNGHGAAAAFDGAQLARRGRVVVVTVSYRLGALGGLAHPDLADPETGHVANWGLQDKVAAVRWVAECAEAFGGDPDAITLAGQSSGAANVAFMTESTVLRGLFRRVVLQSPPLFRPPMFAELVDAAEYTEALASSLDTPVADLGRVDGRRLFEAERALLRDTDIVARMGRPRTAPVRDGQLIREWPYDAGPTDVPLLIGWTRDEARFWYDLRDALGATISPLCAPTTESELVEQVASLVRLYYAFHEAPSATEVVSQYGRCLGTADPDTLWNEIYTDLVFRAPLADHAARHATAGATYVYEFAYPLPSPGRGTPHAADVPFVFGTGSHPHLARKVGWGPAAGALSSRVIDLWSSFARTGRPAAEDVTWEPWRPDAPSVLVVGGRPITDPAVRGGTDGMQRASDRPAEEIRAAALRSRPPSRWAQMACWPAFTRCF